MFHPCIHVHVCVLYVYCMYHMYSNMYMYILYKQKPCAVKGTHTLMLLRSKELGKLVPTRDVINEVEVAAVFTIDAHVHTCIHISWYLLT